MIRSIAILSALFAASAALSGCSFGAPYSAGPQYLPFPGQGQYIRPEYLAPQPTAVIPAVDVCKSRLYASLVGRHEGAIYIAGLPGRKRIIKPAVLEGFGYDRDESFYTQPPFVQIQEYLVGQPLYASSVSDLADRFDLGPVIDERLTIELDAEGYVQEVRCG